MRRMRFRTRSRLIGIPSLARLSDDNLVEGSRRSGWPLWMGCA